MRSCVIAAVMTAALVLSAVPALAQDGAIELFPYGVDPATGSPTTIDFGTCQGTASPIFSGFGRKIIIAVVARLNGATVDGVSGAEMFVDGLSTAERPAGYTLNVVYPANTIQPQGAAALCETRDVGGEIQRIVNTTWVDVTGPDAPNCQKTSFVELARIELQQLPAATDFPNDYFVHVVAGDPPGNENFPCPSLVLCNYPIFNQVCASGGQFLINPMVMECGIPAVSAATWGAVKGLYR